MSNKINNFKIAISKYIDIDKKINNIEDNNKKKIDLLKDKIKELENPVKELKNQKNMLFTYITNTMVNSNIRDKTLRIKIDNSNYKIRCEVDDKKKDGLTQKFLKENLIRFHLENSKGKLSNEKCKEIALEQFQYLLDSRSNKETFNIVYDKES